MILVIIIVAVAAYLLLGKKTPTPVGAAPPTASTATSNTIGGILTAAANLPYQQALNALNAGDDAGSSDQNQNGAYDDIADDTTDTV